MLVRIFAAVLAGIFSFIGCKGNVKDRLPPDTVTIAISAEPKRLNPVFLSDLVSYSVSGMIFSGLVRFDKDMNIVPDISESWEIKPGGREVRFHLKKGVLWHDGGELTAEDIVFTYQTVVSPLTASHHSDHFGPVSRIEVLDRHTVSVFYSEPYGPALESWTFGIIPKHILQGKDINDIAFDRAPVGTGPYRLKEWVPGRKLRLESFDRHYSGRPGIRNVFLRVIPDAAAQLMELRAGGIDVMELSPEKYQRETALFDSGFTLNRAGSFRYGFLGFNLLDGRFQDKRVRQAISHAIDKDSIVNAVVKGFGSRSTGPYPPEAWYYSKEAEYGSYDPQKAIELLSQAGWKRGEDGVIRKNGETMSFTLLTNYESKENVKTAQIIQSNLRSIGVQTDIRTLDWQAFRHNVIGKHKFEAVVLSRAYLRDPDIYDLWHSSKTGEDEWNFLSYMNPALDSLLEKGRRTVKKAERQRIYRKVHEMLAEEQPCVFLYNADLLFISHRRINGINPSPAGMFHDVADWTLKH